MVSLPPPRPTGPSRRVAAVCLTAAVVVAALGAGCNLLFDIGEGAPVPLDARAPDATFDAPAPPPDVAAHDAQADTLDAAPRECGLAQGGTTPCAVGRPCHSRLALSPPGPTGATFRAIGAFGDTFYFATSDAVYSVSPSDTTPKRIAELSQSLTALAVADPNTIFSAGIDGDAMPLSRFRCQIGGCTGVSVDAFKLGEKALGQVFAKNDAVALARHRGDLLRFEVAPDGGASLARISLGAVGVGVAEREGVVVYDQPAGLNTRVNQVSSLLLATSPHDPVALTTSCTHAYVAVRSYGAAPSRLVGVPIDGSAGASPLNRSLSAAPGAEIKSLAIDRTHAFFVEVSASERRARAVPLAAFEDGTIGEGVTVTLDASSADAGTGAPAPQIAVTSSHVAILGATTLLILKKYE